MKAQFISETEQEVFTMPKHIFQFYTDAAMPFCLWVFGALGVAALAYAGLRPDILMTIGVLLSCVAGFFLLLAYLDWRFDFVLFTIDKMVMVDHSLLHQTVTPVNFEHISSVTAETRYADISRFGTLHFHTSDDVQHQDLKIEYVPYASLVAARVTDIITDFQRRKMRVGAALLPGSANLEHAMRQREEQLDQSVRGKDNAQKSGAEPQVVTRRVYFPAG